MAPSEADAPAGAAAALAERLQVLYEVPPEQFIARRNELAKELGGEGARDEAAQVGALRRPTLAQWATNRLHALAADELGRLLDAGAELRGAQLAAAGGDRDAARRLTPIAGRERESLAALSRTAAAFLQDSGHTASEATLRALETTLHTAATGDDALRDQLAQGRLSANLEAPGFDDLASVWTPAPAGARPAGEAAPRRSKPATPRATSRASEDERKIPTGPTKSGKERRDDVQRLRAEREARRDAQRAVVRLRRRVDELAVRARRANQRVEAAREAAAAAQAALAEAQADAAALTRDADQAAAELEAALAKVEDETR